MEISVVTWFWRGLKGHSITFSALFASVVLGISIAGSIGQLLRSLGLHWLYVIILPGIFFGWVNSREARWIPDEKKRRRTARGIIFGSALLAVIINQIKH